MEEIVYHTNYQLEDSYWWFTSRNRIVLKLVGKFCGLLPGDTVLDAGCGTGGFAKLLSENYNVLCLDTSPLALEYCRNRGLNNLFNMTLSEFPGNGFNISAIFMLDVIEHIEDDSQVVRQVFNLLQKGNYFIVSVPAYSWLWSHHDEVHKHFRRYNCKQLMKILEDNGFIPVFATYFNTLLFPLAAIKRIAEKMLKIENRSTGVDEVSPLANRIFEKIFSFESRLLSFIRFPFGLSIMVIARKS